MAYGQALCQPSCRSWALRAGSFCEARGVRASGGSTALGSPTDMARRRPSGGPPALWAGLGRRSSGGSSPATRGRSSCYYGPVGLRPTWASASGPTAGRRGLRPLLFPAEGGPRPKAWIVGQASLDLWVRARPTAVEAKQSLAD